MTDGELIRELAEHPGWLALKDEIERRTKSATRSLVENPFENLNGVARLQGELAAYRGLLSYVNNRIDAEKE